MLPDFWNNFTFVWRFRGFAVFLSVELAMKQRLLLSFGEMKMTEKTWNTREGLGGGDLSSSGATVSITDPARTGNFIYIIHKR